MYISLPLFGGIWKGLELFVTYVLTTFDVIWSENIFGLICLLFLIVFRYLSGGSEGISPSATLYKKASLS